MKLPTQSVGVIRSASTTPVGTGVLPAQALAPVQELNRIIIIIRLPCYPCGSLPNGGILLCCN